MGTIFISGKINGLPKNEVLNKFDEARQTLEFVGYTVLSPVDNNQPTEGNFEKDLLHRIELLLRSNAVYFLDNWTESTESLIEYDLAIRLNKIIFLNQNPYKEPRYNLDRIKGAIHTVMGLTFDDYVKHDRRKELVYARMLFAHYCFVVENIPLLDIVDLIKRDRATLIYMLKKYDDDVKYNPKFKQLVNNIKNILVEFK
jgi:hypothetical protein